MQKSKKWELMSSKGDMKPWEEVIKSNLKVKGVTRNLAKSRLARKSISMNHPTDTIK